MPAITRTRGIILGSGAVLLVAGLAVSTWSSGQRADARAFHEARDSFTLAAESGMFEGNGSVDDPAGLAEAMTTAGDRLEAEWGDDARFGTLARIEAERLRVEATTIVPLQRATEMKAAATAEARELEPAFAEGSPEAAEFEAIFADLQPRYAKMQELFGEASDEFHAICGSSGVMQRLRCGDTAEWYGLDA